jgi:thymidylate synthase ThyX
MTETLIGKRITLLDKGFIELLDLMPHPASNISGDLAIVNAARVSFLGESKGDEKDKKLLFYLLRHRHTSPFEMVEFKFRVCAPLITFWHLVRHRTWNMNAQCLDGETEIIFDKPEQIEKGSFRVGSKLKLKDLFRHWDTWERKRLQNMQLRTLDEESMLLTTARIGNVVDAGIKPGFRITTSEGNTIICSADHQFLFEDGWKTLRDATGLKVVNERAIWRELPQVHEARDRRNGKSTPHLVNITNIEYVGERQMYDLVVDGDYPNFVANWFIVHNSGRYTEFDENDFYVPDIWRKQSKDNKQASEGQVTDEENRVLTEKLLAHYETSYRLYEEALQTGVSREMARFFLPGFSVYYTWVVKVDAHNLMHFLKLRMANDAQYEIRVYAQAIYEHFFKPALPWTAEAFEEYILKQD